MTGTELTTTFVLSTTVWTDPDLPVTYMFTFIDPSSGSVLTIQSRSALTFGSSTLPAGSTVDNSLATQLTAFDIYNASALTTITLTVNLLPTTQVASSIQSILDASLSGGSVSALKQTVSGASSVLGRANCTTAPDCASLNRASCSQTTATCGACLTGYVSNVQGDSNVACVSQTALQQSSNKVTTCSQGCESVFQYCDTTTQTCQATQKTSNCNNGGKVVYYNVNSNTIVTTCDLSDSSCVPKCSCPSEYGGPTCSKSSSDIATNQNLRVQLLSGLSTVQRSEDTTPEAVKNLVSSVSSLIQSTDDVSADAGATLNTLTAAAIPGALTNSDQMDYTSVNAIKYSVICFN